MAKDEIFKTLEEYAKTGLILDAILSNDEMDKYDEPCKVNIRKYDNYLRAIEILSDLKKRGKCDFQVADIQEQYVLHTIYIDWEFTDDFWVVIDKENKKEIKELLDCMDECAIRDDEANIWQLSSKIFVPIKDLSK